MPDTALDRTRLLATTANRLRLVQADFADEPADARAGYLVEEVQRAVNKLPAEQRPLFINELKARFPAWEGRVDINTPQKPTPTPSLMDAPELRDPAFLVARLIELAPNLNEEQRRSLSARLTEAGLSATAPAPDWPLDVAKSVRAKLSMADSEPLNARRTLEVLADLTALTASLDQLVWSTWKMISVKNPVRRPNPLQKTLGRFIAGDSDTPRANVSQEVERLRQLTAALVAAVGQIGRQFLQRHLHKFQPEEIQALVQAEKSGGMFVSEEVKCWRKYKELAIGLDEATVDTEIQAAIVEYAEKLIKGLGH